MKLYFAAPFERRDELGWLADRVHASTRHKVVASWLWRKDEVAADRLDAEVERCREIADTDEADIKSCDLLVGFYDGKLCRGGCMVELGIARGAGKRVLVVGVRQTVFHSQRNILAVLANAEELLSWLKSHTD